LKRKTLAARRLATVRINHPETFEILAARKEPFARWAGEQGSMYHI
jgi:hypothetical protein